MSSKPDIEKLKAEHNIEGLVAALNDGSWAAKIALGELKDTRAVDPLIDILKHGSRSRQVDAIEALGEIGDSRAVEPIITALKSEYRDVHEKAADALGTIGDIRAIDPLIEALKEFYSSGYLTEALAKIGKPAIEPLVAALKDSHIKVRWGAISALESINDIQTFEPIVEMLKDSNIDVRQFAVHAIGYIGGARATEPLVAALMEDSNWSVQLRAARALKEIGWEPTDNIQRAFFVAALRDWDEVKKLGTDAIKPFIAMLTGESNDREYAVNALQELKWEPSDNHQRALYLVAQRKWDEAARFGADAIKPLVAMLRYTESDNVREGATQALVKIGDIAVETLVLALKDRWRAVASALGEIGNVQAVEPLIDALKDSELQTNAAEALGKIGDLRAVEPLIAALKDDNIYLLQSAAKALGKIGDPRAIEPLVALKTHNDWELGKAKEEALRLIEISKSKNTKPVEARKTGESGFASQIKRLWTNLFRQPAKGTDLHPTDVNKEKESSTLSVDEVVDLLIKLYSNHPDGFRHGSTEEKPVIEIGKVLNQAGGMKLMRYVHERFAERNQWCARNLESAWDGIGEWQG